MSTVTTYKCDYCGHTAGGKKMDTVLRCRFVGNNMNLLFDESEEHVIFSKCHMCDACHDRIEAAIDDLFKRV